MADKDFYRHKAKDILKDLDSSIQGLSKSEAEKRLEKMEKMFLRQLKKDLYL